MKKIIIVIIIIALIVLGWFYFDKLNNQNIENQTPEQVLDQATQADTTDDIDQSINSINTDIDTEVEFKNVDDTINSI